MCRCVCSYNSYSDKTNLVIVYSKKKTVFIYTGSLPTIFIFVCVYLCLLLLDLREYMISPDELSMDRGGYKRPESQKKFDVHIKIY